MCSTRTRLVRHAFSAAGHLRRLPLLRVGLGSIALVCLIRGLLLIPFEKDTTYFGKPTQSWMVNFRVADLKAMVAQLRAAGVTVEEPQSDPNGDFARLHDPEGNPIELWEPKEPE